MLSKGENDIIYKDDEYKEQHKDNYVQDIHEDIVYSKRIFKKIRNKYFIDNRSVEQAADDLMVMIQNISENK